MIARASLACLLAAGLAACATPGGSSTAQEPAPETGPLRVTLLGDYAGKALRIAVDDQVLVEQRLTFPPMGAEHRYDVAWGAARTAEVRVEIEDCEGAWTSQLRLAPGRSAHLLFRGCQVEALAAD